MIYNKISHKKNGNNDMKRYLGNIQAIEGLPRMALGEMINGWEFNGTEKSE